MTDKVEHTGFGLAQVKPEGMSFFVDNPEIKPWNGCGKEFEEYLNSKYNKWYHKVGFVRTIIKQISIAAWDNALMENARRGGGY